MSDTFVPNYEDRYYEVHPAQLKWAMHQLDSVPGYNVRGYAQGRGGMYIVIVQVPIGAPDADWRAPQPQRRRMLFDISPRMVGVLVAVALLCVVVGYAAYSGFSVPTWGEVTAQLPAMPWDAPPAKPHGEPVVEGAGWHWPWESSIVSQPKPRQDDGFRWPWQDAQDAMSETMESVKMAGLMIAGLFAVLATLWIVGIVRGAIGK